MAVGAVMMCMLFIVVDLGQPQRMLNVMLHPTPNSVMFWDDDRVVRLSHPEHRYRLGHP